MKNRFIILASFFLPAMSFAQALTTTNLSDNFFRTGAGLTMGGAYRAVADSSQAILYNPAGMAQLKGTTQATVDYAYQGDVHSSLYGVSAVDFQTSPTVAYGLAFHRFAPEIGGISSNVNQILIGGAYALGSILSIGVTGKGYWENIDSATLQGPRGIDMDAGLLVRPIKILSVGAVGYNLIRGNNAGLEEFPLGLGLGAALHFDPNLKLSADMVRNFNTPSSDKYNYLFGTSIKMGDSFELRGGFAVNQVQHDNYYSAGFAATSPKVDLLFAFSQHLSPQDETYAASASFKF